MYYEILWVIQTYRCRYCENVRDSTVRLLVGKIYLTTVIALQYNFEEKLIQTDKQIIIIIIIIIIITIIIIVIIIITLCEN